MISSSSSQPGNGGNGPRDLHITSIQEEERQQQFQKRVTDNSFENNMEATMSLNPLIRLPISSSRNVEDSLVRHSLVSTRRPHKGQRQKHLRLLIVEAKGKKGMAARQYQRTPPPPLPKIEDDGNPRFVIFIRMANV